METWWEWASKTHSIVRSPHSLGTLIEWKLPQSPRSTFWPTRPHSLGTLIEWKLIVIKSLQLFKLEVPTRWGH